MPDLASVLKQELRRLAKREANALTAPLRKAVSQLRQQAWALNRQSGDLRRQLAAANEPAVTELPMVKPKGITRLGPTRIRALRRRLGLTQPEFAKLIKASTMSVGNWESGRKTPSTTMRAKIIAARTLTRTAAAKKLVGKK
jgi:DNA-binding transcriptional regulator YiaG